MINLGTLALVVCGFVLLFAGAALSVYGVVLLGTVIGGGGGYLVAPTVAPTVGVEGGLAVVGAVAAGSAVGAVGGYLLLSFTVTVLSFLVGGFIGLTVLSPFVGGEWYLEVGLALAAGLLAALAATLLTRTMLIVITSVVGASLASTSLTVAEFQAARDATTIEPLLFEVTPLFAALVILGVLSQVGLFKLGYVTRLTGILPGAKAIPGRGGEAETD